ncbi:MAG: outer membrane protein assembly factor BamA [Chloroflexota bacterium]
MRLNNFFLRSLIAILGVFLLFSSALFAQMSPLGGPSAPQTTTYKIAGITVEGNKFADVETIISLSGLRVGDNLALPGDQKIQSAINNLWTRKQFSDIDIVVDRINQLGIFLIIKVKEFPRVNRIFIEGNKEIESSKILEAISKRRGDIVSNHDLYLVERAIKKLYSKEGLEFAQVDATLEGTDTAYYYNMRVNIREGVEFHVKSINFEGNKAFDDDDLASAFDETHTKSWWQVWRSSKFEREEYEKDKELLLKYYHKRGYSDASIVRDTVVYDEAKEAVYITIEVSEGDKIYIRKIDFRGNTVYPSEALISRLDMAPGDAFDSEKFEKNLKGNEDQTDAASLYMDNGYLQANLVPEQVRASRDSVDIVVNVFENERFTIDKVTVIGNTKTKDKVIRRELYTRPGDYFDRSAIIRSVRALGATNYFNPEGLKPDVQPSATTSNAVDVIYTVEERPADQISASLGYAGSYGLTGAIGLTFNNFSITEPFKGGAGQVLNLQAEWGQMGRYNTYSLGFTEPWLFDDPTTIGFNIYDQHYENVYTVRTTGIGLNIGRRFKWPDDYWRGDWSARVQLNDIGYGGAYYREGKYSEVTIGQRFSRLSVNSPFFPTVGSKFSFSNDFAMGAIGVGSTDYLKSELSFEFYNPVYKIKDEDRVVFYINAQWGHLTSFKYDTTISPREYFYMGGSGLSNYFGVTPLRGYEDQSIGPQSGGRFMTKYGAELRFALSLNPMPLYFYMFGEAGNVWKSFETSNMLDLKRSAGVGVQVLLMPIGNIGFSYGYGFDRDITGRKSGWKFLFHLGQQ